MKTELDLVNIVYLRLFDESVDPPLYRYLISGVFYTFIITFMD